MAKKKSPPKKKPARKQNVLRKPKPAVVADHPSVRVRMYRHGLGDCFLLTFHVGGDERHMLIDCGTLGNKSTSATMPAVVNDIVATLDGGPLHVAVATHEHKDHVSGFAGKQGLLEKLSGRVEQAWLAWTENPEDPDAQRIAKYKDDLGTALSALVASMPDAPAVVRITDLFEFAGSDPSLDGAAGFAKTIHTTMESIRKELAATTIYHEPGTVVEDPLLPGFRFYVLGPPRASESLKELGGHGSDDLYHISAGLRSAAAMLRAAALPEDGAFGATEVADFDAALPFDQRYNGRGESLLSTQYPNYLDPAVEWRSINQDWLGLAHDLALQLDSLTNNTSLALAIERIGDGKVLLFPGDAQLGNWLSWHAPNLSWEIKDNGETRRVTASELLARTVFYKVGHHASHNATASQFGLELMQCEDELVAFIPVDRTVALSKSPKGSWRMPARSLYRRLLEKCQGRVVRSDLGWAEDVDRIKSSAQRRIEKELRDLAEAKQWTAWRKNQSQSQSVEIGELYVQYMLL